MILKLIIWYLTKNGYSYHIIKKGKAKWNFNAESRIGIGSIPVSKHLDVFNTTSSSTHIRAEPKLNGNTCPNCQSELFDTYPNIVLTSNPAQKNVNCSGCDYVGYRFI